MIDYQARLALSKQKAEDVRFKKLLADMPIPENKPLGKDEDFLQIMKYIAKRLDFQIVLQLQLLKELKKKK